MDNDRQQAIAAVDFTGRWAVRGYEKGKNQEFWLELLVDVLRVTIEQKSLGKDLRKPLLQCDGAMMGLLSVGSGEGLMTLGGSLKTGAKIAVQSVIGGTLSELGGGNFANGAITAAFSFLFNHLKHFIHTHDDDSAPGIKIANEANRNLGSKKWSKWLKPIGPKCSIFVQDILHSLGYYDGVFRQAGIWGDPSIEIDGWIQIPYDEVQCGDIAAYKEKTSDASGHMGIMFYSNSKQNWTLIYAGSSQHPEQVVRSLFFVPSMPGRKSWFEQHNWIFRRYVGK